MKPILLTHISVLWIDDGDSGGDDGNGAGDDGDHGSDVVTLKQWWWVEYQCEAWRSL